MNISRFVYNPTSKTIDITCKVETGETLNGIYIDNQYTFVCRNEASDIAKSSKKTVPLSTGTTYSGTIDISDINYIDFQNDLLFVFFEIKKSDGSLSTEAVYPTYNEKVLYTLIYNEVKSDFRNCCSGINTDALSKVYLFYGIKFALNSGNYYDAKELWKTLYGNQGILGKICGC